MPALRMSGPVDLAAMLAVVTLAASIEEIVSAAYLRDRLARWFEDTTGRGLWPTGVATSLLFGIRHGYPGTLGIAVTTATGLALFVSVASTRRSAPKSRRTPSTNSARRFRRLPGERVPAVFKVRREGGNDVPVTRLPRGAAGQTAATIATRTARPSTSQRTVPRREGAAVWRKTVHGVVRSLDGVRVVIVRLPEEPVGRSAGGDSSTARGRARRR